MKYALKLVLILALGSLRMSAQDLGPKTPPTTPPVPASAPPLSPQSAPASPVILTQLVGVIIVATTNDVQSNGVPNVVGLQVNGPEFLRRHQQELYSKVISNYLGKPMGTRQMLEIGTNLVYFCRAKDHFVVDVFFPIDQNLDYNTIQVVVLEGKVSEVEVRNEGKKWFSDSLIRRQIRLRPGDVVLDSKLTDDLLWLERNSFFRKVNPTLQQGTNVGTVDLNLEVKDRFPARFYGGYDDAGNDVLGNDRFFAGVNWGNAFFLDHQLGFQFTSDVEMQHMQSYSGSYVAPLPWRHTLMLFGYYANLDGDVGALVNDQSFTQEGTSLQASARYTIDLPRPHNLFHDFSVGFDYKRTDNNLLFGGDSFFNTPTAVAQFMAAYHGLLFDRWGNTSLSLEGFYSPGDLVGANSDADFEATRPGATANYWYLRLDGARITKLPVTPAWKVSDSRDCFTWFVRAGYQHAGDRLLPSEQWGLGGWATVRGYDERIVNGDGGWLLSTELRTPEFRVSKWLFGQNSVLGRYDAEQPTGGRGDRLQFLAFMDYGSASIKDPQPGEHANTDLWSVGGGLRYALSQNLAFRFDYGFQLINLHLPTGTQNSRAHLSVTASY